MKIDLELRRRVYQALIPDKEIVIVDNHDVGFHVPDGGGCVETGRTWETFTVFAAIETDDGMALATLIDFCQKQSAQFAVEGFIHDNHPFYVSVHAVGRWMCCISDETVARAICGVLIMCATKELK